MYRERIMRGLSAPQLHVATAFFLFGLLNNVFGVIILSAALDLVGPFIPKGTVLLSTVLPGVCTKLTLPYIIHVVPYSSRVLIFSAMSTIGMLLVALTPTYQSNSNSGGADFGLAVGVKVLGIILASLSSGAGELSFLGLTHYYGNVGLAAWGSGTGAAGLVGAGAYAIVTGPLGVTVKSTLLGSAIWPFGMAIGYFFILPLERMQKPAWRSVNGQVNTRPSGRSYREERDQAYEEPDDDDALVRSDHGLLAGTVDHNTSLTSPDSSWFKTATSNLRRVRNLIIPFMLPLFIVYVGEYTINQGVTPTLLFPLPSPSVPFKHYREFYPTYATIYQLGVFISRSSIFFPNLRFHALYLPSILQLCNLVFLILQAVFDFLPNVWFVFAVIFWEGLLGGGVYVNTFAEILERVPQDDREFSLSATSVSDSLGILLAAFLSMALEVVLCKYQVGHGRDYCNRL